MKFTHDRRWSKVIQPFVMSLMVLLSAVRAQVISELSEQVEEYQVRFGFPQDWTHRHVVFDRQTIAAHPELANIEPRVLHQFMRGMHVSAKPTNSTNEGGPLRRDWTVAKIGASVSPGMSPAKFGFNESAASCPNDYVVLGLNALGVTGGQGNLVAFNNLYSGPGGICGTGGPSLLFSYNTTTAGGRIKTSPVLSLDGKRIAFVESGQRASVFHVVKWATGAGNGTSARVSAVPGVGNTASMTSLAFNATASDTISSPWVDYANDVAYVGSDDGRLFKIIRVFKGTPALAGAPWPITIGTGGAGKRLILSAPVLDQITHSIFVGDGHGILWSINATNPAIRKSLAVGGFNKLNPSILDGPIVDATNRTVFASSSNDGVGAALVQADTSTLKELARARIGEGSAGGVRVNVYDGTFDNNYFNNSSTGFMLVCGTGPTDSTPWRYSFPFVGRILQTAPTSSIQILSSVTSRCSPIAEFFNPNIGIGGTDFFFWGMTTDCPAPNAAPPVVGGCVMSLTSLGTVVAVPESGGTSVVVPDNFSTAGQASSIYFTNLVSPYNAVKLTQNGLN